MKNSPANKRDNIQKTYAYLLMAKKNLAEIDRISVVSIPKTIFTQIDKKIKTLRGMIKFKN